MERQLSAEQHRRASGEEVARRLRAERAVVTAQHEEAAADAELADVQSQISHALDDCYNRGPAAAEEGVPPTVDDAAATAAGAAAGHQLPAGWAVAVSRTTGQQYYYDTSSGFSTYERPWLPTAQHVQPGPPGPAGAAPEPEVQLEPSMLRRVFTKDMKELQQQVQTSSLKVAALDAQVLTARDSLTRSSAELAKLQQEREVVSEQLQQLIVAASSDGRREGAGRASKAATRALGVLFREDLSEAPSDTEQVEPLRSRLEQIGRQVEQQQQCLHAVSAKVLQATDDLQDEMQHKDLLQQQLSLFVSNPRLVSLRSECTLGAIAACDMAYGIHNRARTTWEQMPRQTLWAYQRLAMAMLLHRELGAEAFTFDEELSLLGWIASYMDSRLATHAAAAGAKRRNATDGANTAATHMAAAAPSQLDSSEQRHDGEADIDWAALQSCDPAAWCSFAPPDGMTVMCRVVLPGSPSAAATGGAATQNTYQIFVQGAVLAGDTIAPLSDVRSHGVHVLSVAPLHTTPLHKSRYLLHSVRPAPTSGLSSSATAAAGTCISEGLPPEAAAAAAGPLVTQEALRWQYYTLARRFETLEKPGAGIVEAACRYCGGIHPTTVAACRHCHGGRTGIFVELEGWLTMQEEGEWWESSPPQATSATPSLVDSSGTASVLVQHVTQAWRQWRQRRLWFAIITKEFMGRVDSCSLQFFDREPRLDEEPMHAIPLPLGRTIERDAANDCCFTLRFRNPAAAAVAVAAAAEDDFAPPPFDDDDDDDEPPPPFGDDGPPLTPPARGGECAFHFTADNGSTAAAWVATLTDESRASVARLAPVSPPLQAWRTEARAWMMTVLQQHNRRKLRDLDAMMEEWFGEEDELLATVAAKYEIADPLTPSSQERAAATVGHSNTAAAAAGDAVPRTRSDADRQLEQAIAMSLIDSSAADTAAAGRPDADKREQQQLLLRRRSLGLRQKTQTVASVPFSEWNDWGRADYECFLLSNVLGTQYRMVGLHPDPRRPTEIHEEDVGLISYSSLAASDHTADRISVCVPELAYGDRPAVLAAGALDRHLHAEDQHRREQQADVVQLLSVAPRYNASTRQYSLDFGGRVSLPSAMNYQIATAAAAAGPPSGQGAQQAGGVAALQFGRVSDHEFTVDFKRPLNLVQAVHCLVSARDHGTVAGAGVGALFRRSQG